MTAQPERILLVTERPLLSLSFRELLEHAGWSDGHVVLHPEEFEARLEPDAAALVVVDFEAGLGLDTVRRLCAQVPGSRFVVWCSRVTPPLVQAAMQAGVHGLLSAQLTAAEAGQALSRVWQGERQFRFDGDMQPGPPETVLTPREQQVVALVREGRRNREIAEALNTTEGSVKVYMNRIFGKTGVKTRHELALNEPGNLRRNVPPRKTAEPQKARAFDTAWMCLEGESDFRSTGEISNDPTKR